MENLYQKYLTQQLQKSASLKALYKDIQKDLDKVEAQLKIFVQSPNKIISEISRYLFRKSGKRIRPALVMLCSKLFGYSGQEHILMSALIETIHTASLIHDDIIDNSETRRGKETVHTRWGPNITVLLGDYLYIKAIALSLESRHPEFIRILTETSTQMIEGELHEYYISGNLDIDEKEYLDIIHKKTASLFSASCRIGAILGGASRDQQELLAGYGASLGMAFQIIDDLLDYAGESETMGKPILSDLSEGRITLPLIHTLNQDGRSSRERLIRLFEDKNQTASQKDEILGMVRSNGALDYTFQKAKEFSLASRGLLQDLPDSVYRESLALISDYVISRNT